MGDYLVIISSVKQCLEGLRDKKVVLLLDFDQQVFNDHRDVSVAMNLLILSQIVTHTVFATTSASGEVKSSDVSGMMALQGLYNGFKTTVTLSPFTFSEAEVYCSKLSKVEIHSLYFATGFVPRILYLCLYNNNYKFSQMETIAAQATMNIFDAIFSKTDSFSSQDKSTFQLSIIEMEKLLQDEVHASNEVSVIVDQESEAEESEASVIVVEKSDRQDETSASDQDVFLIQQLFAYKERLIHFDSEMRLCAVYPSLLRKVILRLGSLIPMDASWDERVNHIVNICP